MSKQKGISTRINPNSSEIMLLLEMQPASTRVRKKDRSHLFKNVHSTGCSIPTVFLTRGGEQGLIQYVLRSAMQSVYLESSRISGSFCHWQHLPPFISPPAVSASRFKHQAADSKRSTAIGQTEKVCAWVIENVSDPVVFLGSGIGDIRQNILLTMKLSP